jgi:hypothetical protein
LQIHQKPLSQQCLWLYKTITTESITRTFGKRVQVYSRPVSLVLKESAQQRCKFVCTFTGFSLEILRGGKSLDVYADTSLLQPIVTVVNTMKLVVMGMPTALPWGLCSQVSGDKFELSNWSTLYQNRPVWGEPC